MSRAPLSIFEGISKLPPGHILTIDESGREQLDCYWNVREKAIAGQAALDPRSDEEIIDDVADLLTDAVGRRMVADVPVGAFLSGGINSPTVVALMQAQSSRPVKTFTIGFQEKQFNEAARAAAIAKHLGTDHTELIVSPEETRAVIPLLPGHVRRTFRGLFADPDLSRFPNGASGRDSVVIGRRRR